MTDDEVDTMMDDPASMTARENKLMRYVEALRTEHEAIMLIEAGNAKMIIGANERVPKLEAENAALREIAQAVADGVTMALQQHEYYCAACLCYDDSDSEHFEKSPHDSNCVVTKVRALLANEVGHE